MADATRPPRGRKPHSSGHPSDDQSLTRERIAAAAIGMLDAKGIDNMTMRALAEALGSGVMSLYWHVANKEAVFDLALDSVLAYREPEGRGGDWRGDILHMVMDWRSTMLRHPWSALLLPRRVLGPNILVRLEHLSVCLRRGEVPEEYVNAAIWSIWNYVMGATLTRVTFGPSDEDRIAAQDRLAELGSVYPSLGRSRLLLDDDWDGAFRKGLEFLLDGIGARR